MSDNDNEHRHLWLVAPPTYASSPQLPPNTPGEYLVCWRRPHWPDNRRDGRRLFHSYAKADAFRRRLEQGERQAHALPTDTIFVALFWRPCREWSEIA